MNTYYNENDLKTAAWLRELIKAGLIADGEVDTRSIVEVQPSDLAGFVQCHFFAGIGGWSYALRLAGWADDRLVWTGSCPCQPFSSAGKGDGADDSRDLWPTWFHLIAECRPVVVFGEQVESAIGHGWLDRLCDDLETEDYAVGPVGLPSACVGAFDKRQRLWFVGALDIAERERTGRRPERERRAEHEASRNGKDQGRGFLQVVNAGTDRQLADTEGRGLGINWSTSRNAGHVDECEPVGELEYASSTRSRRHAGANDRAEGEGATEGVSTRRVGDEPEPSSHVSIVADTDRIKSGNGRLQRSGRLVQPAKDAPACFWDACDWLACRDGKSRPVEPGTFPLAHGLPARVGRLRGYGNAINPWVAAEVIAAYMEIGA